MPGEIIIIRCINADKQKASRHAGKHQEKIPGRKNAVHLSSKPCNSCFQKNEGRNELVLPVFCAEPIGDGALRRHYYGKPPTVIPTGTGWWMITPCFVSSTFCYQFITGVQACKIMNSTYSKVYRICCRNVADSKFFPLNNQWPVTEFLLRHSFLYGTNDCFFTSSKVSAVLVVSW